jgi:hypothetical protein
MSDKKKDRHHKQNDAAYREVQRIQPIHTDTPQPTAADHAKSQAYHNSDEKFTAKRENKKTHQHDYRHEQIFRVHESKRGE